MKRYRILTILVLLVTTAQTFSQKKPDHTVWDQILILNVTEQGKVNYEGIMKISPLFYKYFRSLSENPPTDEWSKDEKLAYWINAYNSIAVKMIIDNYPVKDINELHDPWNQKFFRIKDKRYSLDDIEHTILRKFNEPRIHFLINCASFSSPKLMNRAYTAENINMALEKCTKEFINDPTRNIITPSKVQISQIFEWYKDDFNRGDVVSFINKYSDVKISEIPKDGYITYNWDLNN